MKYIMRILAHFGDWLDRLSYKLNEGLDTDLGDGDYGEEEKQD